jgi:hypothetical protein
MIVVPTFPPRLHVLLARDAPTGLVLRRGPSKAVCAIGWDRKRDTFEVGQWLRGRIYERRSDLSPDGKHLIYFAMNGQWRKSRTNGSWTAVSRAPYLHAVALYGKGDCWNGGGLFIDDDTYWLNDGYGHTELESTTEVTRGDPRAYVPRWGGECPGVYFNRLLRDGWRLRDDLSLHSRSESLDVFDKPLAHGWTLRKIAHAMIGAPPGKGVYHDEHELIAEGRELRHPTWEWADVDQQGGRDRLVWAEGGTLWAGALTKASAGREDPIDRVTLLHDFSSMTFEPIAAPYARAKKPAPAPKPPPRASTRKQTRAASKAKR